MKMKTFAALLCGVCLLPLMVACGANTPATTTETPSGSTEATDPATNPVTTEVPATTEAPVTTASRKKSKMKIACVGDSITYGVGASAQASLSYPAQLGTYLKKNDTETTYTVLNYGKSRAYAINNAEIDYVYASDQSNAYTASGEYNAAMKVNADIVLIMLGTNDAYTAAQNKNVSEKYTAALEKIVESFRQNDRDPLIYLLLPPTRFDLAARKTAMDNIIYPAIEDVASRLGCGIIDVHALTVEHAPTLSAGTKNKIFNTDGIHLGDEGYRLVAELVGSRILDDLK